MSNCIKVRKPGLLCTVQDLGRRGAMAWGVPHSGAADATSLRLANLIMGNSQGEAALETTLGGVELEFLSPTLFSVTGAVGPVLLDGKDIAMNSPIQAKTGSVLRLGSLISGARQYIALSGGINVPPVLGSRSTYIKGALGGFEGRPLKRDDVLGSISGGASRKTAELNEGFINPSLERDNDGCCVLRVTPGTMDTRFPEGEINRMLAAEYSVSPESDRMGIRLKGYIVKHTKGADILSGGIEPGAVQVPGSGEPIILTADRQTTGGYTKAFSVISADRPKLGQLRPSDRVRFLLIGLDEAFDAYEELERLIAGCRKASIGNLLSRSFKIRIDSRAFDVEVEEMP